MGAATWVQMNPLDGAGRGLTLGAGQRGLRPCAPVARPGTRHPMAPAPPCCSAPHDWRGQPPTPPQGRHLGAAACGGRKGAGSGARPHGGGQLLLWGLAAGGRPPAPAPSLRAGGGWGTPVQAHPGGLPGGQEQQQGSLLAG
jgi:hypothetical protein